MLFALKGIPGLEITEASDGVDALRKLPEHSFDLVLTDINMPVMDGLKLISLIRGEESLSSMPICVITTEGAQEDRERAIALGADFVFLGRAFMYAVAALGEKGGDHVTSILIEDLKNNMVQLGTSTIEDLKQLER